MNRRRARTIGTRLVYATGAAALVTVIVLVTDAISDRADTAIQIEACRDRNEPKAYLRIRARELPPTETGNLAPAALPIISCQETYEDNGGRPVRLNRHQERRYLEIFAGEPDRGIPPRLPIVRGGVVVDSEPFPAPRHSQPAGNGPD